MTIIALVVVGGCYSILAFRVLSTNGMYSSDVAVKYVQARSLSTQRFRTLDIPYPAQALDPSRRFQPLRAPYVITIDGRVQAVWSASTALFNGVFVRLWDYKGMVLASLISALLVLAAASRLSSGSVPAAMPLILGLATPLWFFATIGWEHAPAMALGTMGWLVAQKHRHAAGAVLAGLFVGFGAALREEVLLLVPGLMLVIWLRSRTWRSLAAFALGLGAMLAASSAVEMGLGRPVAAHITSGSHLLRSALNLPTPAGTDITTLHTFRDRYAVVIQYWLLGYYNDSILAIVAGALAFGVIVQRRWNAVWPLAIVLTGLVGLAARDAWMLLRAPAWVAGLYRLSPFLVFALLPMPRGTRGAHPFRIATVAALSAYMAIAFFGMDLVGGKGFPRILLPLLPLLSVAAWQAIIGYLRAPGMGERWVGRLGLALVGLAFAIHLGATIPAYVVRNRADGHIVDVVDRAKETVVIADDVTTAQALLPLYHRKTILLADSQILASALADRLDGWDVQRLLLVSRDSSRQLQLPGYEAGEPLPGARATVTAWTRTPRSAFPGAGGTTTIDLVERFPQAFERRPRPEVFAVTDASVMGETRRAIVVQQPTAARIIWALRIPERAWLEVGIAMPEQAWQPGDGLMFMIGVSVGDEYEQPILLVMDPATNANDRRWKNIALDLSKYAGREVHVVFNTRWWTPPPDGTTGNLALWGAPRIVMR